MAFLYQDVKHGGSFMFSHLRNENSYELYAMMSQTATDPEPSPIRIRNTFLLHKGQKDIKMHLSTQYRAKWKETPDQVSQPARGTEGRQSRPPEVILLTMG
jgi:hypothetical protein